jgi:hypothetical protein
VEQSLIDLIPKEIWNQFVNAVQNPNQMKSILEGHYYYTTLLTGTTHHI